MEEYYTEREIENIISKCRNMLKREEYFSALKTVNKAINNSKIPILLLERSHVYNTMKRYNSSIKDSKNAHKILKSLKQNLKDIDENDEKILKINNLLSLVYYQITKSLYGKNNIPKAKEVIDRGLKLYPNDRSLIRLRRIIYMEDIELTERQIIQLKETFFYFDKDIKGYITADDIKRVMNTLGCNISDKEIKNLFNNFDENNDMVIDFAEFLTILNDELRSTSVEKELKLVYKVLDVDGDRAISLEEVKEGCRKLDEHYVEAKFEEFCKKHKISEVKFEDFVRCFMV